MISLCFLYVGGYGYVLHSLREKPIYMTVTYNQKLFRDTWCTFFSEGHYKYYVFIQNTLPHVLPLQFLFSFLWSNSNEMLWNIENELIKMSLTVFQFLLHLLGISISLNIKEGGSWFQLYPIVLICLSRMNKTGTTKTSLLLTE